MQGGKKLFLMNAIFLLSFSLCWSLAPQPPIVWRAEWGAREPQCTMTYCSPWEHVTIHHTASASDYNAQTLEDCKARVRAHQDYHMDVNGWCDIGYNFLICKHGDIFEGRYDSLNYIRGAHDAINCPGLGIACMGYFHTPYNQVPTPEMMDALANLIAWQWDALGRSPYGTGIYGGNVENIIGGHRDVASTDCPGDILYNNYIGSNPYSGWIRDTVCAKMDTCVPPTPTPTPEPDIVIITKAEYSTAKKTLTVNATSSKQPYAVLTVVGFGQMTWSSKSQIYTYTKRNTSNPGSVTVTSNLGGSDTKTVTVK